METKMVRLNSAQGRPSIKMKVPHLSAESLVSSMLECHVNVDQKIVEIMSASTVKRSIKALAICQIVSNLPSFNISIQCWSRRGFGVLIC